MFNPFKRREAMSEQESRPVWYAKIELTVIGPNEGPVKAEVEYQATTREFATGLQDKLAQLGIELNKR